MNPSMYDVHHTFKKRLDMYKEFYIAAPWFSKEQNEIVEDIKDILITYKVSFYSPKDECLFNPKKPDPEGILGENISAIKDCKYVIAVTDGKDPGTLWECGYAFAIGKPIIYVWLSHQPSQKFNLVLSASGVRVCMDWGDIEDTIGEYSTTRKILPGEFKGDME